MTREKTAAQGTAPKRIHFVSLGCPKNRVDSEVMAGLARETGYEATPDAANAEVIVVNTCGFIAAAKRESINTVLELAQLKGEGPLEKLIVAGCLPQRYPKQLPELLPEVDHFIGTGHFQELPKLLTGKIASRMRAADPNDLHARDPDSVLYNAGTPRLHSGSRHSVYLKISEGCSNKCSFCAIPAMRGQQMSRGIDDLVAEAQRHAEGGTVELDLIAQDLTAYGYDLKPRRTLYELLAALNQVDGLRWIRLLYAYPRAWTNDLIDLVARGEKIVPYVDMPLQHINTRVLRSMRRPGDSEKTRKLLYALRKRIPNLALRTTFIVGYPTETDAEFEELAAFVEEFKFDHLGVFPYSLEEDTPSGRMEGQLSEAVKKKRVSRIMRLQKKISRARLKGLVGATADVMVDGPSPESEHILVGRLATQAPDIDGVVYIVDGIDPAAPPAPGTIVPVKFTWHGDYDLVGAVLAPAASEAA